DVTEEIMLGNIRRMPKRDVTQGFIRRQYGQARRHSRLVEQLEQASFTLRGCSRAPDDAVLFWSDRTDPQWNVGDDHRSGFAVAHHLELVFAIARKRKLALDRAGRHHSLFHVAVRLGQEDPRESEAGGDLTAQLHA